MGRFNPKMPKNPTPDSTSGSTPASSTSRSGGWRDRTPKAGSSASRVTVGDDQTVSVVTSGGHRTGGWRDRGRPEASSSVKAGKGSRVTERTSNGDIKNVRS